MSNLNTKKHDRRGVELLIHGIVQGVGFRPFVYNLATRLQISGTVGNSSAGVIIRAAARPEQLILFQSLLQKEAPPLARIFSIEAHPFEENLPDQGFHILASVAADRTNTGIPPDIALCRDCFNELIDPDNRRFGYPFINCTNCGPRFTIVESIPYDRPQTSMKVFPMCPSCTEEYRNPANRRFHAQPNACADCGPHLSWHDNLGRLLDCLSPVREAATALKDDKVIALRGLGGFHLAVNAFSETAVGLLRKRKGRPDKPLAIMVSDTSAAKEFAMVSDLEERTMTGPECPIVLLTKKDQSGLAEGLAPGVRDIGIMLPYTPLHHLLFQVKDCPEALVMTSGNVSGEPICTANDNAIERLGHIADFFLLHNRDIVTRIDDSVVKIAESKPRLLRRSRGFVPSPLRLSCSLPPVIGCGGGLKSTFCLGREETVYSSQHIGDLFNLESYEFYAESVEHLKKVFEIEPEVVACDLHPDYLSSRYATSLGLPIRRTQHHHAHAVAVMAEHNLTEPVLAVVLDGTGYGPDGTIWGGEFLLVDQVSFRRLGHLQHMRLPGGDAATMEPWRMGCSALYHAFGEDALDEKFIPAPLASVDREKRQIVRAMMVKNFNAPLTSSCGRLFDAVASLLGIRLTASYEGQAAMELEAAAAAAARTSWKSDLLSRLDARTLPHITETNGILSLQSSDLIRMVHHDHRGGMETGKIALRFHFALIGSILAVIRQLSDQTGLRQVVLSGGCLQNKMLLEGLFYILAKHGLRVFTGSALPVNDGGVSVGQAIIGGLQHVSGHTHAGYEN